METGRSMGYNFSGLHRRRVRGGAVTTEFMMVKVLVHQRAFTEGSMNMSGRHLMCPGLMTLAKLRELQNAQCCEVSFMPVSMAFETSVTAQWTTPTVGSWSYFLVLQTAPVIDDDWRTSVFAGILVT